MQPFRKTAAVAALGYLGAFGLPAAAETNAFGVALPADAAPAAEQVLRLPCQEGKSMDLSGHFYEADKSCGGAWMYESMLYLDLNNNVVPGAAERWERTGDTWTFHLRKDGKWSDGSPVTAHDFERALKRSVDLATGNNWSWYYSDIAGYGDVTGGKIPPDQLGVKAVDDYTLEVKTNGEILYFDQIMAFPSSIPVPGAMLDKVGENWATDAATALSNGPWKLAEYTPGIKAVLVPNEQYTGIHKPFIERFEMSGGDGTSDFNAYRAGEVDALFADQDTTPIAPADYRFAKKDPELSKELYSYPYYGTRYVFFDTNVAPWNDVRVREAIARAVNRQAMIDVIYDGLGSPAYGMLPPGFPAYKAGRDEVYQSEDIAKAKQLLADAGYPDGKGFPEVELWVKTYEQALPKTAEMLQQMLKQNLGITIKLKPVESAFFNTSLGEGAIDFGIQNWQFDFIDPSNFLNVWAPSLGRHKDWNNAEFNTLVTEASAWADPAERLAKYAAADELLSKDYGGAFLYHMGQAQMWKPWVGGIQTDDAGTTRVPYYGLGMHNLYIKQH
jgi:oligopeptide transport system substrate-binding protein